MFEIYDGRQTFYQWDKDRKIIVKDATIDEVHFCNKTDTCSLVVKTYKQDNLTLADVPNVLLQNDWNIRVYGYCEGSYTKQYAIFKVATRTKPADYVYTEVELWNAEKAVEEALEAAKESGDFKGEKGDKGDAGSIKFTVVTELPQTDDGSTIYLVPSGEGEEGNAYDEFIYNDGAWEKIGSASVEVNLDEYVKKTDYASYGKVGVASFSNSRGISVSSVNGAATVEKASDAEIAEKTQRCKPIVPYSLDYAVKVAVTTNNNTLTDDEKASAQAWLGLDGSNIPVATEESYGTVKCATNKDMASITTGIYLDGQGRINICPASNSGINYRSSYPCPIVPSNLDYAIKVGITTNTEALTDEEKTKARAWLDVPSSEECVKKSTTKRCVYGRLNGEEATYYVDFSNAANVNAIPFRALYGGIYIPSASIGASGSAIPAGQEAVNKKYVDDLIAELTARIEALEGVN